MEKFNEFNKGLYKEELSFDDIVYNLKNNCKSFISYVQSFKGEDFEIQEGLIFRKSNRIYGKYGAYINPIKSKNDRISPFSQYNYHNLLVSNLDSWKKFPRRNKSIIASGLSRARSHLGKKLYLVVPYDNAIMGVCPENDFWKSFKYLKGYKYMNEWVAHLIIDILGEENHLLNWVELKEVLDKTKKQFIDLNILSEDIFAKYFYYFNMNKTLLENIDLQLSPKNNWFKLLNIENTYGNVNGCEVWTESECILIDFDYKNEIIDLLRK